MHSRPEHTNYDVVIVGARVAGAATAMLLARRGLRVLALDSQSFGSDTLSTHALMRGAVRRLADWGLLESVWNADTPVITKAAFTYGDDRFVVDVQPEIGVAGLAAPRRTVLDPILVNAARADGAEVLHDTRVQRLLSDGTGRVCGVLLALADGAEVVVAADLVVGADGLRSLVARAVDAPVTARGDHASAYSLRYYTDLDIDRSAFAWLFRPGVGGGLIPTTGGAVCVFTGMRPEQYRVEGRRDLEHAHHQNIHSLDPELAESVRAATPIGPMRSFPGVRGQFRKPYGPGWALVGDAGYFKDPYAAHGITDAFRDAELLTQAVLTQDFRGYETLRNELSKPLFDILDRIASYDWNLEMLMSLHDQLSKAMRAEEQALDPDPPVGAGRDGRAKTSPTSPGIASHRVDGPLATRQALPVRLLGIWAHPDDEAYLSAGLMARVIDAGGSVTIVTATSGEKGTDDPVRFGTDEFAALRRAELTTSLMELGVTDVRFLGLGDGDCESGDDDAMATRLLEVIDDTRPDTIITFGPDGITGHPDHLAVSRWTTEAWHRSDRDAELLYAAMTEEFLVRHAELHGRLGMFAGYGRQPDPIPTSAVALCCSLTAHELARKRRALACHASQTAALAAAVGEDVYFRWWRHETFRRPATLGVVSRSR